MSLFTVFYGPHREAQHPVLLVVTSTVSSCTCEIKVKSLSLPYFTYVFVDLLFFSTSINMPFS